MKLDVKRCYLPFIVRATCPKCGAEVERDLRKDYVSFPEIGGTTTIHMVHDADSDDGWHEWPVDVAVDVRVRAVSGCSVMTVAA